MTNTTDVVSAFRELTNTKQLDRGELLETAAAAGFDDLASRIVMAIEQDGRPYPVFLLTGRRA